MPSRLWRQESPDIGPGGPVTVVTATSASEEGQETMSVDYSDQDLTDLADKIRTFHTDVSSRVTSLNAVVDMIQGGWQGAAGKEFDSVQRGVNQHLKKLQDNLVDLEEVMRMSVKGFTQHEQDRVSEIRKVDNSYQVTSRITDLA